jgi:flagellar basal body-associated protein FliL
MSTVTSKSYVVAVDQQDKSRKLLRIILILVGVIIFVAAIFLAIVIYRTLKTGAVVVLSSLSVGIHCELL